MDFGILGPLTAKSADREVALGGDKRRTLLAFLILHRNQAVSTDALIDAPVG